MLLYCFYVASFTIIGYLWSPPFPSVAYVAAITGSVVGGCGAGFLWTSQGSFLTLSAHAIAKGSKEDVALVTARLASGQSHLYYPPVSAHHEYTGDDTHLATMPRALIFAPLVFQRKLPLLATCMTCCSVRCNIRGIRGLIQADGVDFPVGVWQEFCLHSVRIRSFVLAAYYATDILFERYTVACCVSTLAVALFIPSPPPLQNAPGQAADVVRPGILLVYDFITNRDNRKSGSSLIWCFLPFNVLFGFASALFTFWINGSVAAAAGARIRAVFCIVSYFKTLFKCSHSHTQLVQLMWVI
jgi:hypothetical protein